MGYPLVENEWRRILARLRRHGVQKTCEHVLGLIETGPYPLIFGRRLIEHLLRRGERESVNAAGRIIEALDRRGTKHPLLDELHSSWLWCMGKRRAALSFALKSARRWRISYVVHKAGTVYRALYNRTGSNHHRKMAERYWRLAHSLVRQEEAQEAEQARKRSTQSTIR